MTTDKAIKLIVSCVEAAESEYGTGESWHKEWEAVEMASNALRQPKIIYCKDCEYYHGTYCEKWSRYGTIRTKETGYCYRAKRRER